MATVGVSREISCSNQETRRFNEKLKLETRMKIGRDGKYDVILALLHPHKADKNVSRSNKTIIINN